MRIESFIHRTPRLLFFMVISAVVLSLSACDSGGENGDGGNGNGNGDGFPEPPGRPGFTSSVAGAFTATFSGRAVHGAGWDDAASSQRFAIRLQGPSAREASIVLLAKEASPPLPGMHAIGAEGFTAYVTLPGQTARLQASSGTLEITGRGGSVLEGHFRFNVERGNGRTATVSGAFFSVADL